MALYILQSDGLTRTPTRLPTRCLQMRWCKLTTRSMSHPILNVRLDAYTEAYKWQNGPFPAHVAFMALFRPFPAHLAFMAFMAFMALFFVAFGAASSGAAAFFFIAFMAAFMAFIAFIARFIAMVGLKGWGAE